MELSPTKTLARKYRITVPQVYRRYRAVLATEHGPRRGLQVVVERDRGRLARDPPIDWTAVKSQEDFLPFTERDTTIASAMENEVLSKRHKALMLFGLAPHDTRRWRGRNLRTALFEHHICHRGPSRFREGQRSTGEANDVLASAVARPSQNPRPSMPTFMWADALR